MLKSFKNQSARLLIAGIATLWPLANNFADAEDTIAQAAAESESIEEESLIPSITINGRTIISSGPNQISNNDVLLPDSLKNPDFKKQLNSTSVIKLFTHTPKTGLAYAPIEIIEFMDLGCPESCRNIAQRLTKLQERHADKVKFAHIYMPAKDVLNPVNFYGKIAHKEGVFWQFREKILLENITRAEEALRALLDLNVSRDAIRLAARRDAEKFYRELDQEKLLAMKLALKKPPHLFINGIHIGEGGIPLENLEDVILFELVKLKENAPKF